MSTTQIRAEELLAALSQELGMPLAFVDGGECVIEHDDGAEISIQVDEATDALMICAPLLPAGGGNREALFAWLLELNLMDEQVGGAVVGLDRTTDMLGVRYRLPLEGASAEQLGALLVDMFAMVERLGAAVVAFQQGDDDDRSDVAPPPGEATSAPQPTDLV